MRLRFLLFVFMIVISEFCLLGVANAWIPPAGSPMAKEEHPRILFITDSHRTANPEAPGFTVREMRAQLSDANYSTIFNAYLTEIEGMYNLDIATRSKLDITYTAINYAFLYKLDPDNWAGSGFTFGHTTAEYGAKAKAYGDYIAQQTAAVLPTDSIKHNWSDYKTFNYGGGDAVGDGVSNISMAIVADWCPSLFTKADKQAYMEGFKAIFDYAGGIDGLSNNIFTSGHHYGVSQNCGGIFAFYGEDIDDAPSTKYADYMADFGTKFETDWLIALKAMDILAYEGGSNDFQGPSYGKVAANNMAPFVSMMSTSLGENFFQTDPYWSEHGDYDLYTMKPLIYDGVRHDILTGDAGDYGNQIDMYYGISELYWYPVIKNTTGLAQRVARWTKDTYYTENTSIRYDIRSVFCYFFNGYADVEPLSPEDAAYPLSKKLGRGQYQMVSEWDSPSATSITFLAPKFMANYGGHVHFDFAAFKIFKHGNITEDRQVAKDFPYAPPEKYSTQKSMFRNTIGVLYPAESYRGLNLMGYRGGIDNYAKTPEDPAYHMRGANNVGIVRAESLEGIAYDYIDYDYSRSWDPAKVDYAEREFTYLRSAGGTDDEYVVVFDRINSVNASSRKHFLLQCMWEPEVLNAGDQTSEKYPGADVDDGGRWVFPDSSSASTIKMINTYDTGHAAMMTKTLLPTDFQFVKVGGPGHYWEDALGYNFALYKLPESGVLPDEFINDYGSYTMQVLPTVPANYDTFLNVMQVGDSNTLSVMTDTVRLTATTGNLVGAHIKDSIKNRIVLFNDQKRTDVPIQKAPYTYTCEVTSHSFHLLTNIEPYSIYSVETTEETTGTTIIATPTSSLDGVLSFSDTINSRGKIMYAIEKIDNAPAVLIIDQKDGMTVHSSPFMVTGSVTVTNGNTVKGVSCMVNSVSYSADPVDGVWDSQCEKWSCKVPIASKQENNIMFEANDSSGHSITREFTVKRDNLCACP